MGSNIKPNFEVIYIEKNYFKQEVVEIYRFSNF